jgi:hypothetical protein
MVEWGKTIAVLVAVLVVTATVDADMVPVPPMDAGYRPLPQTCIPTDPRLPSSSDSYAGFAGIGDLGSLLVGFPPQPNNAEAGQTSETRPAHILTDRQNSLSLCLYALLSVGLCQSVPLVKKLHFGCIPDWYHSGGPYQIGHSFAIAPDCLSPAPVCCFVQPDQPWESSSPQYCQGTVVSLWRRSQFTPTTLAPRGPPLHLSCR